MLFKSISKMPITVICQAYLWPLIRLFWPTAVDIEWG